MALRHVGVHLPSVPQPTAAHTRKLEALVWLQGRCGSSATNRVLRCFNTERNVALAALDF